MPNGGGRGDTGGDGGGQRGFPGDPGAGPSGFGGQRGFQGDPRDGTSSFGGQGPGNHGGFNGVGYDYGRGAGRGGFDAGRGGFNGGGRGYQGHDGYPGFNAFNDGYEGGGPPGNFYGNFHPGAGGGDFFRGNDFGAGDYGYRNRRRYEFRGNRANGNTRGRGRGRNPPVTIPPETQEIQGAIAEDVTRNQNHAAVVQQQRALATQKQQTKTQTGEKKQVAVHQKATKTMLTGDAAAGVSKATNVGAKQPKKKEKNPDKIKCFRCDDVGHFSIDCKAEICDFCESADHANDDCHLHIAPKPKISMYGYGHEELMFLEVDSTDDYRPRSDSGRMCRIKVSGGVLSIENIVERLRWLVDDNFSWDVQPQGDNVYKTQFPNKQELVRATRFGSCKVKDTACSIEFTEWKSAVQPVAKLDEVWILTSGVPDDEGYKLTFEVEEDFIPVDEDEDMLNAQDGDDDKEDESRNAEQSKDKNSNNKRSDGRTKSRRLRRCTLQGAHHQHVAASFLRQVINVPPTLLKRRLWRQMHIHTGDGEPEKPASTFDESDPGRDPLLDTTRVDETAQFLNASANKSVIVSDRRSLDSLAVDAEMRMQPHESKIGSVQPGKNLGVASVVKSATPVSVRSSPSTPNGSSMVSGGQTARGEEAVSPTREQVIAFGGVADPLVAGVRSSDRIRAQPNADETQLHRAMHLAQLELVG
ncbi:hypothetical protein ACQ4PT_019410 [Festuca glaucescens]